LSAGALRTGADALEVAMSGRKNPKPRARRSLRFEHLLVPTDLTARTEKALDVAATLAASNASRITLVHVIETSRACRSTS
jgi:K+-sensing histidine kinase KdpD